MPVSKPRQPCRGFGLSMLVAPWIAASGAIPAFAQTTQPGTPAAASSPVPGTKQEDSSKPTWAGDLDTRQNLLGDAAGLRPALDARGITIGLSETTEVLGNATGGTRQGAIVEGLTEMSIGLDTAKLFGVEGGTVNASAFQIHGRGLSGQNLGNLNVVSGIEADPSTRLNELWYQQSFLAGKVDIKIGQQSADLEFTTSQYGALFINSGFGWPTLAAVDLPSGGPAYPLPTPGIRLRAHPTDTITTLLGVFDGSPAGLKPGDPQVNDPSGTNFDLSSGAFVIGEVQYAANAEPDAKGLPGTYKLGAWYNTNRFADAFFQRGETAQPPGVLVGIPRSKNGNWSVYAVADQLVDRPSVGSSDGGLGVTARIMGAPGDRNVIDAFIQGGLTYKGAFGRDNDTMGLGVEQARVSARARAGDLAARAAGSLDPVRSSETVVEATYQAQIYPWWLIQPDVQFIINPGAGLADPNRPNKRVGDAVVFGTRSIITF